MAFDIMNPNRSAIASGIEGKSFLIYGGNKCGKTWVCAHMPKPFFFAFELGLEATNNVPYVYPDKWVVFMQALDQFVKNPDGAKALYQTIVIDQLEAMYSCAEKHVCAVAGVSSINKKPKLPNGKEDGWWNGYVEVDRLIADAIQKIRFLLDHGYTFCFIAHEGTRKDEDENEKIYPRGNKRMIDPIVDLVGFICYVKSNGVDASGKVIKSSAFLHDTPTRLAGGRFTTVTPYLQEFTAEALVKATEEATQTEAALTGAQTVTNAELVQSRKVELPYEETKQEIGVFFKSIYEADPKLYENVRKITEKHLGAGKTISDDTTPDDAEILMIILEEVRNYAASEASLRHLVQ